jgi:DNA-binding response OmpR family regulator
MIPNLSDLFEEHARAVLLVDDEESILLSLSNYLEQNHFQVKTATNGLHAVDLFRQGTFDLVITDLVMNGMSGIELLYEIKEINSDSGVFILTGQGNMASAIEALRLGANDYLLKPCDADELVLRMKQFFEKQQALRKIKVYENFLPICMYCKRIRDDTGVKRGTGKWMRPEIYLKSRNHDLRLSHGCCPHCYELHKDEWFAK